MGKKTVLAAVASPAFTICIKSSKDCRSTPRKLAPAGVNANSMPQNFSRGFCSVTRTSCPEFIVFACLWWLLVASMKDHQGYHAILFGCLVRIKFFKRQVPLFLPQWPSRTARPFLPRRRHSGAPPLKAIPDSSVSRRPPPVHTLRAVPPQRGPAPCLDHLFRIPTIMTLAHTPRWLLPCRNPQRWPAASLLRGSHARPHGEKGRWKASRIECNALPLGCGKDRHEKAAQTSRRAPVNTNFPLLQHGSN